ncbi:MAG: OmpA family protein [Rhodoferax sp.]|nr:OmpA family protein [Rhodoferax sp.]
MPLWAADSGTAKIIRGDVRVERAGASVPLRVGDAVLEQDRVVVPTGASAGITLRDDTRISLGPNSTLVINRFKVATMPAPEVLVVGHTDALGTDSLNDELSMQRARIVRAGLIDKGIDSKRVEAVGRGKRELLVPTRDGVAESRNRRVEIQVR